VSTSRFGGHLRSCEQLFRFRTVVSAGGDDIPGQQLLNAANGMVGEAGEYVAQVALWIEAIQFRGTDQAVEDGGALSARLGAGKKVVLASQSDGTQGPFGGVVVCVLKRCTAFPGESPGRPALVPAGST